MLTVAFGAAFFFFNDTATTEIYTLSLHDALPIWKSQDNFRRIVANAPSAVEHLSSVEWPWKRTLSFRSEEHTSELQSQSNLVCRLLLEKNNDTSARSARSGFLRGRISPQFTAGTT